MKVFLLILSLMLSLSVGTSSHAENKDHTGFTSELVTVDGKNQSTNQNAHQSGTLFQWFGHAFIYLTSNSGIRIAINPFSTGIFDYTFPRALPADIVLVSCESADFSGGKELFGIPQVFRSLAGVGLNNANGLTFRGTQTYRDDQRGRKLGGNTVYSFTLDGVRYCHLGAIGHTLTFKERSKIGKVDVLFLPVGNPYMVEADIWKLADSLKAKWIVPVAYKTDKTKNMNFRKFSDMNIKDRAIHHVDTSEVVFRKEELPQTPTLLILKSP